MKPDAHDDDAFKGAFDGIGGPDAERESVEAIMTENEKPISAEGELRYLISWPWLDDWKKYARCDVDIPDSVSYTRPGPCDNSHLLEDPARGVYSPLKANLQPNQDYTIVPKAVWEFFCTIYPGSGPAIPRPYIQSVRPLPSTESAKDLYCEFFPVYLRVCVKGSRRTPEDGLGFRRPLMHLPKDMSTPMVNVSSTDKEKLSLVIVGEQWRLTDLRKYLASRLSYAPHRISLSMLDSFPMLSQETKIAFDTDEDKRRTVGGLPLQNDDVLCVELLEVSSSSASSASQPDSLLETLYIEKDPSGIEMTTFGDSRGSGAGSAADSDTGSSAVPSYADTARSATANGGKGASGNPPASPPPSYSSGVGTYPATPSSSYNNNNYSNYNNYNYSSSGYSYSSSYRYQAPPSPEGYRENEAEDYGVTGLRNLGNTCYMNSGIQCLSQIPTMRYFFLSGTYKDDINLDNPLGWKGKAAEAYAFLTRKLYSPKKYGYIAPSKFKAAVGEINSQFKGYAQQDAQEFIGFLLDALHEDLNRVKKKPPTESVNAKDFPTHEAAAAEAWSRHLLRNQSVIVDIFQGQFRSTVVCCKCSERSVTFDPFASVSLPLPIVTDRTVEAVFVPFSDAKEPSNATSPTLVRVTVPKSGPILELKKQVAKLFEGVDPELLVCMEVYAHKFYSSTRLGDENLMTEIGDGDHIYLFQTPAKQSTPRQIRSVLGLPEPTSTISYTKIRCSVCGDFCYSDETFKHRKCRNKPICIDCMQNFRLKPKTPSKKAATAAGTNGSTTVASAIPPPPPRNPPGSDSEMSSVSSSQATPGITPVTSTEGAADLEVLESALDSDATPVDALEKQALLDEKPEEPKQEEAKKADEEPSDDDPLLRFASKFLSPCCREQATCEDFIVPAEVMTSRNLRCDSCYTFKEPEELYVHKPCFDELMPLQKLNTICEDCYTKKQPSNLGCYTCRDFRGPDAWMRYKRPTFRPETPPPPEHVEDAFVNIPVMHRRSSHGRSRYETLFGTPFLISLSVKDLSGKKVYDAITTHLLQIGALKDPSVLTRQEGSQDEEGAVESSERAGDSSPPPLVSVEDEGTSEPKEAERGPFDIFLTDDIGTTCRQCRKPTDPYSYYSCSGCKPILPTDDQVPWMPTYAFVVHWNMEDVVDEKALDYVLPHESIKPKDSGKEAGLTLHECFLKFAKPETLSEEDPWYCPACKEFRQAIKTFEIWKRPDTLVVHLKRFHVSHGFYFREKIETFVDYPLEMDVSEYICGPQKLEGGNIYDLIGVVIHFGGMGGGHYIAYTKHSELNKWFEYNDSIVKEISLSDVKSRDAYCLVYQRRGTTAELPPLAELVSQAHVSPFEDAETDKASSSKKAAASGFEDEFDPVPKNKASIYSDPSSDVDEPSATRRKGLGDLEYNAWN